jgi:hypothetical protein
MFRWIVRNPTCTAGPARSMAGGWKALSILFVANSPLWAPQSNEKSLAHPLAPKTVAPVSGSSATSERT